MSAGKWKRRDARDEKYNESAKPKKSSKHGQKPPPDVPERTERWQ